jgi:hypothetical protein
MQILLTNTKKNMNSGPYTITSTQSFNKSITINGVVTPHLNKIPVTIKPSVNKNGKQYK